MLIAPTEPSSLRALGTTSSLPEKYGVDVAFPSPLGLVGIQRKEIKDLIASVHDGRLAKELGQMKQLSQACLVVEGEVRWTQDGNLYSTSRTSWTRRQHHGLLFSVASQGVWTFSTNSTEETGEFVLSLKSWMEKARHGSLGTRPKATGEWGTASSREWGSHVLQSFPGIGTVQAGAILNTFGSVPLRWTIGVEDLQQVKGIGAGKAEKLWNSLNGS